MSYSSIMAYKMNQNALKENIQQIVDAFVADDNWTDIAKAGADVVGNAAKVAIDIAHILVVCRSRQVQNQWQDIVVSTNTMVLASAAKVAIDVAMNNEDYYGKREFQDGLTDLAAAVDAKVAKVFTEANEAFESRQKYQDVNLGSLIVAGAAAIDDVFDLGKSIGHLISVWGNKEIGARKVHFHQSRNVYFHQSRNVNLDSRYPEIPM